jgi:hypothetical protein
MTDRRADGVGLLASGVFLVMLVGAVVFWWERRIEAGADPTHQPLATFDDYVYYYPTSHYAFGELRAGRLPLWNPYQHAGSPFLATAQHGIFYLPNLVYLFMPTATAEKVGALLHLTIAGLGAALLGRTWRQCWPGAAAAGIAFAFAPPVAALVYLPPHLYAVAWIPLQLLVLHRLLASPKPGRWAVPLGACVALQYLGGYPQYCLMSVYVLAAYFCWWQWGAWRSAGGRQQLIRTGVAVAAAAVLAVSLSAPQLLPNLELAQRSLRGVAALSLEEAAINSVHPATSLLRAVLPMHDVEGVLPSVYAGVALLFLAGLGAATPWRTSGSGFFLGLTIVSWMLAWGTYTPLFRLYHLLPGGGAFRCPYRFFPVTSLGIAVLAGTGVDALWGGRVGLRTLRSLMVAALALGVVLPLIAWLAPLPNHIEPASPSTPAFPLFMMPAEQPAVLVTSLGGQLVAAAAWLSGYIVSGARVRRALVTTLPAIVYGALFVAMHNTAPLPVTHPDFHTIPEPAVAFLRSQQGVDRTYVAPALWWPVVPRGPTLPARAGVLHGIYAVNDRENMYSKRFADFAALMLPSGMERDRAAALERLHLPPYIPQGEVVVRADSPNLRLLDLLGTRFIVEGRGASFRSASAPQRFEPVFDEDGVRIYRNLEAFPRAFLVYRTEVVSEPRRVLERLASSDFDPRTTALLEAEPNVVLPATPAASGGSARIVRYTPDEVQIDVSTPAAGILVLTDLHYPGWESEVDGKPADILVTDYVFRGVAVDAGTHHVVFHFVPHSFWWGLLVAALGSMLVLGGSLALRGRLSG